MKKLLAMLLLGSTASAQNVPSTVMYTGKLADGGIPVDGVRNFDLRLYDDPTAGTLVWDEQYFSIPVVAGLFNVVMGSAGNPVDPADLSSGNRWLQVAVDGVPLLPRIQVHSVPYAIVAGDADSLQGFTAMDFAPVTAFCPPNSAIQSFDASGNAVCETDDAGTGDITGVTAGIGLMTGGTSGDVTLDVDFASFGTCIGTNKVTGWNALTGALECGLDVDSGGTVTDVDTGSGLTGGPISDSGTISVATGGITSTHLADATVLATVEDATPATQFTVTDGANGIRFEGATGLVATFGAVNHRVIYGIAPGGVTSALIAADTIADVDIATGAVTTAEILDNTVASGDIAVDTIVAADIATGGVATSEILDGTVAFADWSLNTCTGNQVPKMNMAGNAWVCGQDNNAGGTVTSVGTGLGLTGGLITTTGTVDLALNAAGGLSKILGVGMNELGLIPGGVDSSHIADNSITSGDIANATIALADMAANSVDTSKIVDSTIVSADIADSTIGTADIGIGGVATSEILDGTIGPADIEARLIPRRTRLTYSNQLTDNTISTTYELFRTVGSFTKVDASTQVELEWHTHVSVSGTFCDWQLRIDGLQPSGQTDGRIVSYAAEAPGSAKQVFSGLSAASHTVHIYVRGSATSCIENFGSFSSSLFVEEALSN